MTQKEPKDSKSQEKNTEAKKIDLELLHLVKSTSRKPANQPQKNKNPRTKQKQRQRRRS